MYAEPQPWRECVDVGAKEVTRQSASVTRPVKRGSDFVDGCQHLAAMQGYVEEQSVYPTAQLSAIEVSLFNGTIMTNYRDGRQESIFLG